MFTIRQAEARDVAFLPAVERSAAQLFLQDPDLAWLASGSVQSPEEHLEMIKSGAAWVAVDSSDSPIGFCNGEITGGNLHISEVSVDLKCQGQGIGRQLMAAAREWAISSGRSSITLTTFRGIPWTEGFYMSLGFVTLETSELTSSLINVMKKEADAGLQFEKRCAMRLLLM